ncbi:MAG: FmdB family zinc ribbon protein [Planctomycetota bacterium]|nr:FmdB family zinc ribbon protein [Planctomycetota bacterium]
MPTYEYICRACEHEFEEFQSMSAAPLKKCPECGKASLERKIGVGAGIIFKGGGFYETDYRSDSYKKAADADSKASASSSDKSDHVHSGTCGCGKKPADQCPSSAAPSKTAEPAAPASTKLRVSASGTSKPAAKSAAPKSSRAKPAKPASSRARG